MSHTLTFRMQRYENYLTFASNSAIFYAQRLFFSFFTQNTPHPRPALCKQIGHPQSCYAFAGSVQIIYDHSRDITKMVGYIVQRA